MFNLGKLIFIWASYIQIGFFIRIGKLTQILKLYTAPGRTYSKDVVEEVLLGDTYHGVLEKILLVDEL